MPLVLPLPLCRALSQRLLELRSLSSKALVGHYLLNEAIFDFTLCPCPISPNAVSVSLILLADLVFVGLTFSAGLSDPKWQRILFCSLITAQEPCWSHNITEHILDSWIGHFFTLYVLSEKKTKVQSVGREKKSWSCFLKEFPQNSEGRVMGNSPKGCICLHV